MQKIGKIREDLSEIIKLIEKQAINVEDGALNKFSQHIMDVKSLGRFSLLNWNRYWRQSVYDLGIKLKELDPVEFIKILDDEIIVSEKDNKEVLEFYKSEIEYQSLDHTSNISRLEALTLNYPHNPEFRQSIGNLYLSKGEYKEAIEQYTIALSKDKSYPPFLNSLFMGYNDYLETFILSSRYSDGLKICNKVLNEKIFWEISPVFHNAIVAKAERFKDHILIEKNISSSGNMIKEKISNEMQKGQFKTIEILGFFTAIIALIFSTISIGKNFKFNEAIIFNISLSFTLLIFVLLISMLFSVKQVKLLDYRVLLVVSFILALVLIVARFGLKI